MRRIQFSVKSLLWLMAVVAAFLSGEEWARRRYQPKIEQNAWRTTLTMTDGTVWVPYLADR